MNTVKEYEDIYTLSEKEEKHSLFMVYYSIKDLEHAYSLPPQLVLQYIKAGALYADIVEWYDKNNKKNMKKYIIPATELPKLENYRNKEAELVINPMSQPVFYINQPGKHLIRDGGAFSRYMGSQDWIKTRNECYRRDNYQCRNCGKATNIEAHHTSYEHWGTPKELDDLITLCHDCHEHVHMYDIDCSKPVGRLFQY